jgi:hypothetical protein
MNCFIESKARQAEWGVLFHSGRASAKLRSSREVVHAEIVDDNIRSVAAGYLDSSAGLVWCL